MIRRRTLWVSLSLLGLVLTGTLVVLSSISYYLHIDTAAYLTEHEVGLPLDDDSRWNATEHGKVERIPRILHQTWKSETLPAKWKDISQACRDMMPDYEYVLWTDASSREFIAEYYDWFLDTFDNYQYPIQRADVIRYFVLYHYGGIYLDLDIGCLHRLDPLLDYPVILPKTIPVGISNDLMFAEKGHPFLAQTIHKLISFDYSWVLNYPTVMFSTGPMFLSAQYGIYTASHPPSIAQPGGDIRVLPKSLYGKNAKPGEAPHAFFTHYYGSSWHAGDAGFIGFLGKWGKVLMWIGLVVLVIGLIRLALFRDSKRIRKIGGYEILYPRWQERDGRWHLDLGLFTLPGSVSPPSSPISLASDEEEALIPLPIPSRSSSPSPSEVSLNEAPSGVQPVIQAFVRTGNRLITAMSGSREPQRTPRRPRRRGVMFFLPAIFASSQDIELSSHHRSPAPSSGSFLPRYTPRAPSAPPPPPEKRRYDDEFECAGLTALDGPQQSLASRAPTRDPSRAPTPLLERSSSRGSEAPPYDQDDDIPADNVSASHRGS